MADALPHHMGIAWTVTNVHLVVLGVLLLPAQIGLMLRLFMEQSTWVAGLVLTAGNRPDEWVLTLHLWALFCTALLRWMWARDHPHLRRGLLAAGLANLAIAPIGLVPGIMLLWLHRRYVPGAVQTMAVPTGKARRRLIVQWLGAVIALAIASVAMFALFEAFFLAWIPAIITVGCLPALAWWQAAKPPSKQIEQALHAMPPLPDISSR